METAQQYVHRVFNSPRDRQIFMLGALMGSYESVEAVIEGLDNTGLDRVAAVFNRDNEEFRRQVQAAMLITEVTIGRQQEAQPRGVSAGPLGGGEEEESPPSILPYWDNPRSW